MARLTTIALLLRAFTALLACIELGITAYVVYYASDYFYEDPWGDWGVNHDTPSQVAFVLFASAWSILALMYLALAPLRLIKGGENEKQVRTNLIHRCAVTGLDVVTMVFWLAGWIALVDLIGGPTTCADFCAAIQASAGLAAGIWACFAGSGLIDLYELWERRRLFKGQKDQGGDTGHGEYDLS